MQKTVQLSGQKFLVHSSGQGYPLNGLMICGPLQAIPTAGAVQDDETYFAHLDDKLHAWNAEQGTFVAVKLSKYNDVFARLNNSGGAKVAQLEAEVAALTAQLTQANAEVAKIRQLVKSALG